MFSNLKLGLRDHDPVRLARTPTLADVSPQLFAETPRDWQIGRAWDSDQLYNDWLGCCGPAAIVNFFKVVCAALGIPCPYDAATVLNLYRSQGWDGTDATDNGVVLAALMAYLVQSGILDAFMRVPFGDRAHFATAHDLGGPIVLGVTLTESCKTTDRWDAKAAADSKIWGKHAVLVFSVSPGLYRVKSWGRVVDVEPEYLEARGNEAYLPLVRDMHPNLAIDWDRLREIAALI